MQSCSDIWTELEALEGEPARRCRDAAVPRQVDARPHMEQTYVALMLLQLGRAGPGPLLDRGCFWISP